MSLDKYARMIRERSSQMEVILSGESTRGHIEGPVKGILFDIYGTLFISGSGDLGSIEINPIMGKGLQRLLDQFDLGKGWQSLLREFKTVIEMEHQAKRAAGIRYPEVKVEEIWAQVIGSADKNRAMELALQYELLVNPVYPMPHLRDTLARVRESGVTMGLISNAQFFTPLLFQAFLKKSPEHLGFDTDLILYSYMHGVAKPARILFSKAADMLVQKGIPAASVVYVGNDMRNDIIPAQQVGFQTVLFAGDRRSLRWRSGESVVAGYKPHMVVIDLQEILKVIE